MNYIVAISGGIDSVVLLYLLVQRSQHHFIVAHFDHGIRSDSADDARFVEALAKQYGLPFVHERKVLGSRASEELARKQRYAFLRKQAQKFSAKIITAHHADDIVETIAINLQRGTGWRGLAVLNSDDIIRPLIGMTKEAIRAYALKHRLEWVEDSTNSQPIYLRNRLRAVLRMVPSGVRQSVLRMHSEQIFLANQIDRETKQFLRSDNVYRRYFFIVCDDTVALEVARQALSLDKAPTRPQAQRALLAVKTAKSGSAYDVGNGIRLRFTATNFIVERR